MRRASIVVLLAWIPAVFSAGSGATHVPLPSPLSAATGIAPHDIGPLGWIAVESASPTVAVPQATTIRTGDGPVPYPPVSFRAGARRRDGPPALIAGPRAHELRRIDSELDLIRARSGFLTAASSNAPPLRTR